MKEPPMEEIERCRRCILPRTLPSVTLDDRGICNHCRDYETRFPPGKILGPEGAARFEELLSRVRKRHCRYDCLVPLSGGKDSTYALYLCSKVYNLRCLAITFDNGYLSQHARKNVQNGVTASGADHVYYTVNRQLMLQLYRLFLEKCGSFCPACMRGIGAAIDFARLLDIPLTVSGTGRRVEYLSMLPELFQGGDPSFFKKVVEGTPFEFRAHHLSVRQPGFNLRRLSRIASRLLRLPLLPKQQQVGIYDYFDPSFDQILPIIEREMGWTKPVDGFEHMDCQMHGVAHYVQSLRFPEITPSTVHQSGLVRMGRTTREAALQLDQAQLRDRRTPSQLGVFLREVGMSQEEFEKVAKDWRKMDRFRSKTRDRLQSFYHRIAGI